MIIIFIIIIKTIIIIIIPNTYTYYWLEVKHQIFYFKFNMIFYDFIASYLSYRACLCTFFCFTLLKIYNVDWLKCVYFYSNTCLHIMVVKHYIIIYIEYLYEKQIMYTLFFFHFLTSNIQMTNL